jgi:hypothetical protein
MTEPAEQILIDTIKRHLPYEIDMVRSTFRALARLPKSESETAEQWVVRCALIESFCVHARSLIDFLSNSGAEKDDVRAKDFTTEFAPLVTSKDPINDIRTKLNKQIFHLTKLRETADVDKFSLATDGAQLVPIIEQKIKDFSAALKSEFRELQCKTEPLELVPDISAASSTTSITVAFIKTG